jgi:hypothetical protein
MITRPLWKCSCIKLFITYFRHLEKRHPYWPGPIWASIWKWSCSNPKTGYFPGVWKYGQFTSGHIGHTKMPLIWTYYVINKNIFPRYIELHGCVILRDANGGGKYKTSMQFKVPRENVLVYWPQSHQIFVILYFNRKIINQNKNNKINKCKLTY